MKKRNNKKAFTLTELIIVIAIIAILAAVLIPSITGYVQKAKKSNDSVLAKNMTDELQRYCIENDVDQDELIGTDVRTILLGRGFSLVPSTNKWTFVYDTSTKKVVVNNMTKGVLADTSYEPTDPTNYKEGMYLLGKGSTAIEQAVNYLVTMGDYNAAYDKIKDSEYKDLIELFNPKETLYISNSSAITSSTKTVSRIVFLENTVNIPSISADLDADIKTKKSQILKSTTSDIPYFEGLKPLDISSLKVIDIKNLVTDNSGKYEFKLGQNYENGSQISFESRVVKTSTSIVFENESKVEFSKFKKASKFETSKDSTDESLIIKPIVEGLKEGYYYIDFDIDKSIDIYFKVNSDNSFEILKPLKIRIETTYKIDVYFINEKGLYARGTTDFTKVVEVVENEIKNLN